MTQVEKKDSFHRNLTTVLLTVISVFGVYSAVMLSEVNKKLTEMSVKTAVQEQRITELEKKIAKF